MSSLFLLCIHSRNHAPLVTTRLDEAMVPLIEECLQDFRPRDLVHVADAYAPWMRYVSNVGHIWCWKFSKMDVDGGDEFYIIL